jgi:hypothetical protein
MNFSELIGTLAMVVILDYCLISVTRGILSIFEFSDDNITYEPVD